MLIASTQPVDVQLSGLSLMQQVVRKRWKGLSESQQAEVASQVVAIAWNPDFLKSDSWPLKSKLAALVSDLIIRRGSEFAELTLKRTIELVEAGPHAAHVAFMVLQYVSEEVNEGELGALAGNKRDLLSTFIAAAPAVLTQIFRGASAYVQQGMQAAAANDSALAGACKAAVAAALDVVVSLVAWLPLSTLRESQLMDACAFLVAADEFKAKVVEVCLQMGMRNKKQQSAEDAPHYRELYQNLCRLLCHAVPRLFPPSSPPLLDGPDDDPELVCRLCESVASLAVSGHLLVVDAEGRGQLLEQLLRFLQHAYLPVVALALPAWAQLVQDLERSKAAGTATADSVVTMSDDVVQAVMRACVGHLAMVLSPSDKDDDLPPYVDSAQDWKEFCSSMKSRLKYVLTEAARLAPTRALVIADAVVNAVPRVDAGAAPEAVAAEVTSLEVVSFALEALIPAMCLSSERQACVAGLEAALERLLQLQTRHAPSIALLAKSIEAFAAVVELDQRLAQPVVNALFGLLERMHSLRGGIAAGNDDTAPFVKEQRQLTKSFLTLSARAPAAFVPLLEGVFQRTSQLRDAGVIGDADRNQILEGILASSASQGAGMFSRVVAWLLQPLKEYWEGSVALMASEEAFAVTFLQPITVPPGGGDAQFGGWKDRTRIYYTLQLLMMCARQCKHVTGGDGGQVLETHLEWMLLPALRLQKCLLGLQRPELLSGALQPLAPALQLSPLEKAACIGQQAFMDAKSRSSELEPGRMDGTSVHAIRGWIRQSKELAMILVTECATQCPAFWRSPSLCQEVTAANLYCLHLQEPRSMRLVFHHALVPLMRACPRAAAVDWMQPPLTQIMPLLQSSVTATWRELMLKMTGAVGDAKAKQTEDEIIQEVLLRELSRDVVELLRALVGSTSFPSIPADRLVTVFGKNLHVFGSARRATLEAAKAAPNDAKAGGGEASVGQGLAALGRPSSEKNPSLNSIPWEETVASALMPVCPDLIAAAIELATQAMSWPDLQTSLRAVAVARTIAAAAGAPLNPVMSTAVNASPPPAAALRPLLVNSILPGALVALSGASAPHLGSEMLLLIRSIYIACAAMQPSPQEVLSRSLPSVTGEHLAQLNAELEANKSEKHHKEVFKRFFTAAGFTSLETRTASASGVGPTNAIVRSPAPRNTQDSPPHVLGDLFP